VLVDDVLVDDVLVVDDVVDVDVDVLDVDVDVLDVDVDVEVLVVDVVVLGAVVVLMVDVVGGASVFTSATASTVLMGFGEQVPVAGPDAVHDRNCTSGPENGRSAVQPGTLAASVPVNVPSTLGVSVPVNVPFFTWPVPALLFVEYTPVTVYVELASGRTRPSRDANVVSAFPVTNWKNNVMSAGTAGFDGGAAATKCTADEVTGVDVVVAVPPIVTGCDVVACCPVLSVTVNVIMNVPGAP
jgi:hypothetical protein